MHRCLRYLCVILSLVLVGICQAESKSDSAAIYGLVEASPPSHDTIVVHFDMSYYGPSPDSIGFLLYNWGQAHDSAKVTFLGSRVPGDTVVIFRAGDSLPVVSSWYTVRFEKRLTFRGALTIYTNGVRPEELSLDIFAFVGSNRNVWPEFYCPLDRSGGGITMNFWVPNFGVYKSELGGPLSKKGLFASYTIGFDFGSPRAQGTVLTNWSGLGKHFAFAVPLQIRAIYYPLERYQWSPFGLGGINLSKVKVSAGDEEFRKVQFGGEIGGGVTDGLDRLTYSYSTAAGGYHTVELFVAANAWQYYLRAGSYFLFRMTDDLWMFELGTRVEGMPPDFVVRGRDMQNRPVLIKALSWAGILPYLPVYGLVHVLGLDRPKH